MYLGQCLQMQSNIQDGMKVRVLLIVDVLFLAAANLQRLLSFLTGSAN